MKGAVMMWGPGTMGWGGWLLMSLVMVGFWALVVYGIVAIFRGDRRAGGLHDPASTDDPIHILEARFARGEIDADDFTARRQALTRSTGPARHTDRRGGARG